MTRNLQSLWQRQSHHLQRYVTLTSFTCTVHYLSFSSFSTPFCSCSFLSVHLLLFTYYTLFLANLSLEIMQPCIVTTRLYMIWCYGDIVWWCGAMCFYALASCALQDWEHERELRELCDIHLRKRKQKESAQGIHLTLVHWRCSVIHDMYMLPSFFTCLGMFIATLYHTLSHSSTLCHAGTYCTHWFSRSSGH